VPEPVQEFFSIGEVCSLTDLKPHVLRYWEKEFTEFLTPDRTRGQQRRYTEQDIDMINKDLRNLLYRARADQVTMK